MKKIYLTTAVLFFTSLFFGNCFAQSSQLLGMTYGGGTHSSGTIFNINSDGSNFQTIYSFDSLTGRNPYGTLMQANDGKLYGMTYQGGLNGFGVLFRFDPINHDYKDLVDFNYTNGAHPYGSLIQATNGKLYGMTSSGGANSDGVLFSFTIADSMLTKLIDFSDSLGYVPKGDLMQASNGNLYGLTSGGGSNVIGVLFSFNPSDNSCSKLFSFSVDQGMVPYGSLIEGDGEDLYGTTRAGGANSAGVLFRFNASDSSYSKLLDFTGGSEQSPSSGVTMANNGKLYGMTLNGGSNNIGSVYSFDTSTTIYSNVLNFDSVNGSSPSFNTLMQASNNKLYGMTVYGGVNNDGVIFSFNPADSSYTKLIDFSDTTGKYPNGTLLQLQTITGLQSIKEKMNVSIYPNPATDYLNIRFNDPVQKSAIIYITNVLGEITQTEKSTGNTSLNIKSLSAGIYFVKLVSSEFSGQQWNGRFVKE